MINDCNGLTCEGIKSASTHNRKIIHKKNKTSKCKLVQHTVLHQKKQALTRATKIDKEIDKQRKPSCLYQKDACQKPGSQQESKYVKENCGKPVSGIKEKRVTNKK